MGKKALVSKICLVLILIIINILAVILSLVLIAAGTILIVISIQSNVRLESLIALVAVVFALGVLFLIISILGLVSSISSIPSKQTFRIFSTCAVSIYMVVLLVLILAQVSAMVAGIILRAQIADDSTLEVIFNEFVRSYNLNPAFMTVVDGWQNAFMCCGYNNYSSWFINGTNFTSPILPLSCCNVSIMQNVGQCMINTAFSEGCSQRLLGLVSEYIGAVIGVFAGITVFQIAILVVNLVLICCIWLDKGTSAAYRFRSGSLFTQENSFAVH